MFSLQIEHVYADQERFSVLFHANHLLYSAFGYLLYTAGQFAHAHVRAILLLQIWNALVGVGVVYRMWTWSQKMTRSSDVALLCAALFAFGATWWKFATDADPYIIAVRLLFLAILFAAEPHPRFIPAGLCHVGSMLFHELAVFGYVPILLAIWTSRHEVERTRWREITLYTTITAAATVGLYYMCYRAGAYATHPTLIHWVTNYAGGTDVAHSARQIFGTNLASYGKLFAGGKISALREHGVLLLAATLLVASAAIVWCLLYLRKDEKRSGSQLPPRIRWVLWSWIIPYALFLAWFDPGNAGHKLFLWPPLVLLLATSKWSQRHATALTGGVLALAAWNFGAFIFPHSQARFDPLLSLAQQVDRELPRNAAVYYATFVPDDWYLDYFAPGRTWRPLTMMGSDSSPDMTTCFDATALEHLKGKAAIDPKLSWRLVDKQHNVRLECVQKRMQRNSGN